MPKNSPETRGGQRRANAGEARLVAAARDGDRSARGAIVDRYQKMVYNLALRLTGNVDEAEVVLQETFLSVFAALPRFRESSSLRTWVYRITTNEALQRIRRQKGRSFVEIDHLEADPQSDLRYVAHRLATDPHRMLEDKELTRRLEMAVGELPPRHRAAFVLVDMEGLSTREAATVSKITVSALKSDLHRARLFLRDRLGTYMEGRRDGQG